MQSRQSDPAQHIPVLYSGSLITSAPSRSHARCRQMRHDLNLWGAAARSECMLRTKRVPHRPTHMADVGSRFPHRLQDSAVGSGSFGFDIHSSACHASASSEAHHIHRTGTLSGRSSGRAFRIRIGYSVKRDAPVAHGKCVRTQIPTSAWHCLAADGKGARKQGPATRCAGNRVVSPCQVSSTESSAWHRTLPALPRSAALRSIHSCSDSPRCMTTHGGSTRPRGSMRRVAGPAQTATT